MAGTTGHCLTPPRWVVRTPASLRRWGSARRDAGARKDERQAGSRHPRRIGATRRQPDHTREPSATCHGPSAC